MLSTAQRCLRIVTHLDILLFFGAFFGGAITESYICKTKPISLDLLLDKFDLLGFFSPSLKIINNTTGIEECNNHDDNLNGSSICMEVTDIHNNQSTIWDYRVNIIEAAREYGMGLYHVVYLMFWVIIVSYFVMELNQYCLLLKGINTRRARFLYKWVAFRVLILVIAITIAAYDISGFQATCTDVFVIPFGGFRLMHLILVGYFTSNLHKGYSSESIVMTGSEKLGLVWSSKGSCGFLVMVINSHFFLTRLYKSCYCWLTFEVGSFTNSIIALFQVFGTFNMKLLAAIALFILTEAENVNGSRKVKIRKCCPPDEVIDIVRMKCGDSGYNKWTPWFYKDNADSEVRRDPSIDYDVETRIPSCPGGVGVHLLPLRKISVSGLDVPEAKFRLLKSGRLVGQHFRGNWIDVPENSCIDGIINYNRDSDSSYTGAEADQVIITCPVIDESTVQE